MKNNEHPSNFTETVHEIDASNLPAATPAGELWSICSIKSLDEGEAKILLYEVPPNASKFVLAVAERLSDHYIAESFLKKNGRKKIAEWLQKKIPTGKKGRSGDLGEILATEFVNSGQLPFIVPIHRLRWKDGRDLAMRGEDIVGFRFEVKPLRFLKGEAKSRERLTPSVVAEARTALVKNEGLPLAHTLSFIAERLSEAGEDERVNAIEEYVLRRLPSPAQVCHLIFTFSENDPAKLLQDDAKNARMPITHYSVGLKASNHQALIKEVFSKATNG